MSADEVARGPGPGWLRVALVVAALLYYLGLVDHPASVSILRPIAFLTQSTCLFPDADAYAIEYHLEGWSCADRTWHAMDPRPYFRVHADDKESRYQRAAHFYETDRAVMQALERYLVRAHDRAAAAGDAAGDDGDGLPGAIGGIRVSKFLGHLPAPGDDVARYHFDPMAPVPGADRVDTYYTPESRRRCACTTGSIGMAQIFDCRVAGRRAP